MPEASIPAAVLLGLLLAAPLSGQQGTPRATPGADAFSIGDLVRLRIAGAGTVEGRVRSVNEETLTLEGESADSVRTIPFHRVGRAWIRTHRSAEGARKAATGAAGLAGLGFGALSTGLCDRAVCEGVFTEGFVRGAVIGAAVGAGIGAVVGSFLHAWQPLPTGGPVPAEGGRLSRITGSVRYGEFGLLRSGAPPGSGEVAASIAWRPERRGHYVLGLELGHLGFEPIHRRGSELSRIDEEAAMESLLAAASVEAPGSAFRLTAVLGPVRSRLERTRTPHPELGAPTQNEHSRWGLRTGAGLRGGWPVGESALHVGFTLRFEWISRSVVGSSTLLGLGVSVW